VQAAIARVETLDGFLAELSKIEQGARRRRSDILFAGWAWIAALRRLDPARAGELAARLADVVSEPDEIPLATPEEQDLAELPALDGIRVVLSLHEGSMKESEIVSALAAAGRSVAAGDVRVALEEGRAAGVVLIDPVTVAVGRTPRWMLAETG
jgi:hypothetical protein